MCGIFYLSVARTTNHEGNPAMQTMTNNANANAKTAKQYAEIVAEIQERIDAGHAWDKTTGSRMYASSAVCRADKRERAMWSEKAIKMLSL